LAQNSGWYGDNRDRIDAMLAKLGTCGAAGSVSRRVHRWRCLTGTTPSSRTTSATLLGGA
jgi:hypothetical protein